MRSIIVLIALLLPFSVTAEVVTTLHPASGDPGEARRLLEGAAALGADVALVTPSSDDMRALVDARAAFLREGKVVPLLGLAIEAGRSEDWVASALIRFFRQVPRAHWATLENEPLVRITGLHAFKDVHPLLFTNLRRRFRQALGVNPRIVAEDAEAVRAVSENADVKVLGAELAKVGFWETMTTVLASPEFYRAAGEQPTGLVDRVFDKWLERTATSQERIVALERLKAVGARRFAQEVVNSEESRRTLVARWFRRYLDRKEPLPVLKLMPEIEPYVASLRAGQPTHAVLAGLLAANLKATDEAFVDRLYGEFLRGCADSVGRGFWQKRITAASRETAAREFLANAAPTRLYVAEWMRNLLERNFAGTADETVALGEGSCGALAAMRHDAVEYRRAWEEMLVMTPRPKLVIVDKDIVDGLRQLVDRFHAAR